MVLRASLSRLLALVLGWTLLLTLVPPGAAALEPTGRGQRSVSTVADAGLAAADRAVEQREVQPGAEDGQTREELDAAEPAALLDGLPDPASGLLREPDTLTGTDPAVREALTASEDGTVGVIIEVAGSADLAKVRQDADRAALEAAREARLGAGRASGRSEAKAGQAADRARAETVVAALRNAGRAERAGVIEALGATPAPPGKAAAEPVDLWIVNAVGARVDETALEVLESRDDVVSVRLEEQVELPEPTSEPSLPSWSVEKVHAPQTWGDLGYRGEGVTVAVLDTGVDASHPALADQYRGRDGDHSDSWFVTTGENYPEPGDGNGHGTHVTGSVLGGAPGEIIGVAPDAEWIGVKLLTDGGRGGEAGILSGMQWVMAPGGDAAKAPDIASNSWGSGPGDNRAFWEVVTAWRAAGILPVFANGNDGPGAGTVGNPGGYPHSLGVGATDRHDTIASFSSRGPVVWDGVEYTKPQVSAPGAEIRSAWPLDLDADGYHTISGTSMATPHVSGVAALVLSASPGMEVDELQATLEETARAEEHMGTVPNNSYGYGIVDAYAASTRAARSGLVSGQVTGPEGPVAATIEVAGSDPVNRATADPETGSYEIHVLAGTHTLEVSAYGYQSQDLTVDVVAGEGQVLDISLAARDTAELSGVVTTGGEPVTGASVAVVGQPESTTYTGDAGGYALTVPEGTHSLRVQAGGLRVWAGEVTVDGDTVQDVALQPLPETGADSWHQLKAVPAGTGLADSDLHAVSLQQQWSARVPRVMFGSPVVTDDAVYIASEAGGITALDRADGSRRWTVPTGGLQRGTPAVSADGATVYATTGEDSTLLALDSQDGSQLWSYSTGTDLPAYGSPTVVDGTVLVAVGSGDTGGVHAVDAATGEGLWRTETGAGVFFGPAVSGGLAVATSTASATVVALDVATGETVWSRPDTTAITMPAISGDTVYLGTSTPDFTGGSVLALDLATGATKWEATGHGDSQGSSPVLYDDLVILGSHSDGSVAAYHTADGSRAWHHYVGTAVTSSVAVTSGGVVLGGSQNWEVFALEATSGELLWEDRMPAPILSSAAVAGGAAVFVSRDGTVASYESTGAVTGTVTGPDGPVAAEVELVGADATVTADPATGAYELAAPAGDYTLRISHYGLSTHTEEITLSPIAGVTVDATLTAVGSGSVEGQVADEAGEPLEGATVQLAGVPLEPVVTGADGAFTFPAVAAGEWELQADLPGYAPYTERVTVTAGETTSVDITLGGFDLAVVADDDGRIAQVLRGQGWSVDEISWERAAQATDRYQALVLNGTSEDRADADPDRLAATVEAADSAGTSLIVLDQWGVTSGSVEAVLAARGSAGTMGGEYGDRGAVWLTDPVAHPVTDSLGSGRLDVQTGGSHGWVEDYDGYILAGLGTDETGHLGTGIGYQRTGPGSVQVLLPTFAANYWSGPGETWTAATEQVLADAVQHGVDAEFGTVDLTVTGPDGAVLDGSVSVVDSFEEQPVTAGAASLLLDPGAHTLRVRAVGMQPLEQEVTVVAGEVTPVEVQLTSSGTGAVAGTVTDAGTGNPVEGASVGADDPAVEPVLTGADGTFQVEDLPAGSYTLDAEAEGYLTAEVPDVVVEQGHTTQVDISLSSAPRVAVVGDYGERLTTLLTDNHIPAVATGWEVLENLSEVDVVVLNDPASIDDHQFLAHLETLDEAEVSVVFPAANSSFNTSAVHELSQSTGSPQAIVRHGGFRGDPVELTSLADHPLFAGLGEEPVIYLNAGAEAPWFEGYQGISLADVGMAGVVAGSGIAYDVRTPQSVHLLLSGLFAAASTHPDEEWAPEARQLFVNAVRWAGAPQLAQVSGTVTDPAGAPVPHAEVSVSGRTWSATTREDGEFVLGLPDGDHTVQVSRHGYVTAELPVSVTDGSPQDLDVELAVAEVGTLTGTVYGVDGSGTRIGATAEGQPVAGAEVRLNGAPLATTTDDQGRFELSRVEAGERELEVEIEGYVRTLHTFPMVAGEHVENVTILQSPTVGVVLDNTSGVTEGRTKEFLQDWGYDAVDVGWTDTEALSAVDLVVVNAGTTGGRDPGADGLATFLDAVNRNDTPVLWTGNYARGGITYLNEYLDDPQHWEYASLDGTVTTTVVADHPLVEGLPESFAPTEHNRMYGTFTGYGGTVVATIASEEGPAGDSVAYDGRTAGSVDVLLSTMSTSSYGAVGTRTEPALYFTPETERLLVNALQWGLSAEGVGADTHGTVVDAAGQPVQATVTVEETGREFTARGGDGSYVVPLDPGTWTLTASAFGYAPASTEVTVGAGESVTSQITLGQAPGASVSGTVRDAAGAPVADATVAVHDTELVATSDADGSYSFTHVPEGDWVLVATAEGHRTRFADVTVADDAPATQQLRLGATAHVALVGDRTSGSMGSFLVENGFTQETFAYRDLADVDVTTGEFDLVLLNGFSVAPPQEVFTGFLDETAAHDIPVVFASQYAAGGITELVSYLGDPQAERTSFKPEEIGYRVDVDHPLFDGYEVGETVTLLRNPGSNQQFASFSGYTGTMLAETVAPLTGEELGGGAAYRFASPGSVHLLLGSLAASSYGAPETRWTIDARRISLNGLDWALQARQSDIHGVVSSEGEPVADAAVSVDRRTVTTDGEGGYQIGIGSGEHTVEVVAEGHEPFSQTVTVGPEESVQLDIELTPLAGSVLTVEVTEVDESPVEGVTVTIEGPSDGDQVTGPDGTAVFDPVLVGDYTVTVQGPDHVEVVTAVTVGAEPATLTVQVQPIEVAVLGDVDGDLTAFLLDAGLPTEAAGWESVAGDVADYELVVVNGGEPTAEQFTGLLEQADEAEVSLVFTGTYGVTEGGIRLLEEHTDDVVVGGHGYRDGAVGLTDLATDHPVFEGLADPAHIVAEDGYYSWLSDYPGEELATLTVGGESLGAAVALAPRTAGSGHLLLSFAAVSDYMGPGRGWTEDTGTLMASSVEWLLEFELAPPEQPTLAAAETLVGAGPLEVSGTAPGADEVQILRGEEVLATVEPDADDGFAVDVDLVEGPNALLARAINPAGSTDSEVLEVVLDTTAPELTWTPKDGTAYLEAEVLVEGTVADEYAEPVTVTVQDEPVEVAADGTFGVAVPLAEGANEVTVVATDSLGNEVTETRDIGHVALDAAWEVPPAKGKVRNVQLTLTDPAGRPVAVDGVTLQLLQDGQVRLEEAMRYEDDRYLALLRNVPRGSYQLQAVLEVDGYTAVVTGPELRVR